jgi:L-threonylcarbamoyladenylate synthase
MTPRATRLIPTAAPGDPRADEGVRDAAALLRAGGLVVMPTETVYGLAADATQPEAVAAVFRAKDRPPTDPLIVHVSPRMLTTAAPGAGSPGDLAGGLIARGIVAADVDRATLTLLATAFWPGPLTLLLPRGPAISDAITAGSALVAVRVPHHPVALALIDATDRPLVAPSANRFGRISPTCAADALAELAGRVDAVLDGGRSSIGVESTVLDLGPPARVLRPGAIGRDALTPLLGDVLTPERPSPASPGQLDVHYAPRTPLTRAPPPQDWTPVTLQHLPLGALGWLGWSAEDGPPPGGRDRWAARVDLSASGDPTEAARNLYAALRTLDEAGVDAIVAALPPDGDGLLRAISDRLRRAGSSRPPLPTRADEEAAAVERPASASRADR